MPMIKRKTHKLALLLLLALMGSSCREATVPKPYGYYRIALEEHAYQVFEESGYPYSFAYSKYAQIRPIDKEPYWMDIYYPRLDARIHLSYKPVQGNLRSLGDDAEEFVYKHAGKATSIPEQEYFNPEAKVYGVFYNLKGNTASPYQFYLTDSTKHFFRGSLYFNCVPNQDSLATVIDYVGEDIRTLIETLRWTR